MIYLITGNPGSKKTAFCMATLLKVENENKVNLIKNVEIYRHNLEIFTQKDLLKELTYLTEEVGSGDTLKQVVEVVPDDYFTFLGTDDFAHVRPDYYFKRATDFNNIIERITELHGEIGLQYFLPVRTIYTNIKACKIDYVRDLEEDWRKCPDGSIVTIDEIQLVYPYKDSKDTSHPVVQELSVHRHRGFDFYFITQSASKLHVLIKDLVHVHYHVTCPFGLQTKIYQYGSFENNPNAITVKLRAESSFSFSPPPGIFKLYKSTTINTAKTRLPIKSMLILGSVVTLGVSLVGYALLSDGGIDTDVASDIDNAANKPSATDSVADAANKITLGVPSPESVNDSKDKTTETAIGKIPTEGLTKEQLEKQLKLQEQHFNQLLEQQRLQLIMQYELMQKQLIEHDEQIKSFYRTLELYKTMLPKDYKELKANPDLQVRGVVKMGNKCKAFNHEGVLMTLNADQCSYYTEAPGRVWKKGQTTDNSPAQPRLPPTLTDSSTTTVTTKSGGSSNTLTKTPTTDPNAHELNEATKPVEKVETPPASAPSPAEQ